MFRNRHQIVSFISVWTFSKVPWQIILHLFSLRTIRCRCATTKSYLSSVSQTRATNYIIRYKSKQRRFQKWKWIHFRGQFWQASGITSKTNPDQNEDYDYWAYLHLAEKESTSHIADDRVLYANQGHHETTLQLLSQETAVLVLLFKCFIPFDEPMNHLQLISQHHHPSSSQTLHGIKYNKNIMANT